LALVLLTNVLPPHGPAVPARKLLGTHEPTQRGSLGLEAQGPKERGIPRLGGPDGAVSGADVLLTTVRWAG